MHIYPTLSYLIHCSMLAVIVQQPTHWAHMSINGGFRTLPHTLERTSPEHTGIHLLNYLIQCSMPAVIVQPPTHRGGSELKVLPVLYQTLQINLHLHIHSSSCRQKGSHEFSGIRVHSSVSNSGPPPIKYAQVAQPF